MAQRPPRRPIRLLGLVFVLTCGSHALPAAAADPATMFLLGFAKNLIESAIAAQPAAPVRLPPAPVKAPGRMDDSDLRTLVDESFGYLSGAQRAELLAGLEQALADPANSAHRDVILQQFVAVAREVGFTHRRLERLSAEDKRALVARFAVNYRDLDPPQQQALVEQLKSRALPLPTDLNEMMLSALVPAR